MQDRYLISDMEQLKAISHPARVRILQVLTEKPMTAKQLADLFGEEPAKTSYHVKRLVRVGLVRLAYTRETPNGIIEKYYQAVAREFQTDPYLPNRAGGHAAAPECLTTLQEVQTAFVRAYQERSDREGAGLFHGVMNLQLNAAAAAQLAEEIRSLVTRYSSQGGDGETYTFHFVLFPTPAKTQA